MTSDALKFIRIPTITDTRLFQELVAQDNSSNYWHKNIAAISCTIPFQQLVAKGHSSI
jgi:hypothetical protein